LIMTSTKNVTFKFLSTKELKLKNVKISFIVTFFKQKIKERHCLGKSLDRIME